MGIPDERAYTPLDPHITLGPLVLLLPLACSPSGWRRAWKTCRSMGRCRVLMRSVLLVPVVLWARLMDFVSQSVQ